MYQITKRDQLMLDFLKEVKIAKTFTLSDMFYPSLRVAQRRLKTLYDNKVIKRYREYVGQEYIYYIDRKPNQTKHSLLLTDFIRELNKINNIEIIKVKKELTLSNVRADGFVAFKYNENTYIACIEIEISNNKFNTKKYEELYLSQDYKKYLPTFPIILGITNKKIESSKYFDVLKIKTDFSNMNDLLSKL
ncbi:hypothetical protein [Tepidibacter mesophilus]|uniref:hypothetical protein n=1 Tax=Tepidibacter mesophilus TaxID=655607 RepID=UPI000C08A8AF|nr:hypothetical protein [Tepidibacter mesophilus]